MSVIGGASSAAQPAGDEPLSVGDLGPWSTGGGWGNVHAVNIVTDAAARPASSEPEKANALDDAHGIPESASRHDAPVPASSGSLGAEAAPAQQTQESAEARSRESASAPDGVTPDEVDRSVRDSRAYSAAGVQADAALIREALESAFGDWEAALAALDRLVAALPGAAG